MAEYSAKPRIIGQNTNIRYKKKIHLFHRIFSYKQFDEHTYEGYVQKEIRLATAHRKWNNRPN